MQLLSPAQRQALRSWFLPDRPGPQVGLHVLQTGHGAIFADRWPEPQVLLADSGGNYALHGRPEALTPVDLASSISGMVDAPGEFLPLLRQAFPDLKVWERVILVFEAERGGHLPTGTDIRSLQPDDAYHLWGLSPQSSWITKTWGGPEGLASSGMAWGAFSGGRLVSVAMSFFVGDRFEDLGVVTEPGFRGRGLSVACAGELIREVIQRGRIASWSTSPDNLPSLRVAEKLGFRIVRQDRLYVAGIQIPKPAQPSD